MQSVDIEDPRTGEKIRQCYTPMSDRVGMTQIEVRETAADIAREIGELTRVADEAISRRNMLRKLQTILHTIQSDNAKVPEFTEL